MKFALLVFSSLFISSPAFAAAAPGCALSYKDGVEIAAKFLMIQKNHIGGIEELLKVAETVTPSAANIYQYTFYVSDYGGYCYPAVDVDCNTGEVVTDFLDCNTRD